MRFRPNPGFKAELIASPQYQRTMRDAGNEVARYWRIYSGRPWMPAKGRRHINVSATRTGVVVYSTDHGEHLKEYGSVNNYPRAAGRRAARSAGLRLRESPKP